VTPSQPNPDPPEESPPHDASAGDDVASAPRLDDSLELVRFLRANCEWDARQTPRSLLPYLLEEAHETADAVAAGQEPELAGELGDLLLNVAFQVVLAEERGAFTAADVVSQLQHKMRRRHPHLYGDGPRVDWETLKRQERDEEDVARRGTPRSLLHGIGSGLEPLSRAQRMQERVATVGFDWPSPHGAFDKVVEEVEEVRQLMDGGDAGAMEEEIGDLLFAVVNLARLSGVHAMRALLQANAKFARRFEALEELATRRDVVLGKATLEELDVLWDEVKAAERRTDPGSGS
jgi:MazG family protein